MSLGYFIRNHLGWPGRGFSERGLDAGWVHPVERGRELIARYELSRYFPKISRLTLDELLGTLDLLDRVRLEAPPRSSEGRPWTVIDIGAKNWRYLGALTSWLERQKIQASVTGVELDAYRLYTGLHTRQSYADYFRAVFSGESIRAEYVAMDATDYGERQSADLVTWFFPFVLESTHRQWGLPKTLFRAPELFRHITTLLKPGGHLIMANQGEWEWEVAKDLLPGLKLLSEQKVEGSLHATPYPIFLTLWTREEFTSP